jgi:AcrR family transcriptional regulator
MRCRWAATAGPLARRFPPPARSPFLPPTFPRVSPAPEPGCPRRAHVVAEERWLRIILVAAEVIRRKGYANTTVAQIAAAAGVDSRTFYRLFAGKRQVLAAAIDLLFRHAMAAAAGAFVAGETWPERVWEAARTLTQYAERNPTLTYVSLVESYAVGLSSMTHIEDVTRAFTIFLLEGDQTARERSLSASGPSEVSLEAIAATVYELVYRQAREDAKGRLSALLGQIVFISLAPFLGADEANDFVCRHAQHATCVP